MNKRNICIKLIIVTFLAAFAILSSTDSIKAASNVVIVIDPGHGGPGTDETNLGACYNGLQEKDVNLLTAKALKNELEQYGNVTVYLTRNEDVALTLKQRVDFAKAVSADILISVHHNASADHLFYGCEAFVPSKGEGYSKGYGVASCIVRNWVKEGLADKGIKTRIGKNGDYYGLIRQGALVSIPTVILEHGYLDNFHDIEHFDEESDYVKTGKLDAKGIATYYGLKKGITKKNVYPTVRVEVPSSVVKDDVTGPYNAEIKIDYYNPSSGEVRYTLSAKEDESRIMYYGVGIVPKINDKGAIIPLMTDLVLWGNSESVKGTIFVPAGYKGPIYGICYNNYNCESNTAVAELKGAVGKK